MAYSSSEPSPVLHEHKGYILVVEDNVLQRFTLSEWLRSQNYVVHEAATADEASLLLASSLVQVDLVITDIWMPGMMDGMDLMGYMRRSLPHIPVIAVSGVYKKEQMDPSTVFLQKPYRLEDVSMEAGKLLAKKGNGH
jgi:CheY-like chemotaxis protein